MSDKGDGVVCYLNLFIYFPYVHDGQSWFSGQLSCESRGLVCFYWFTVSLLVFRPFCPSIVAEGFPYSFYLPSSTCFTATRFTFYNLRVSVTFSLFPVLRNLRLPVISVFPVISVLRLSRILFTSSRNFPEFS